MRELSGGNQQKLVLGRILASCPRFIWGHNPTKGLDIAACEVVYDTLRKQRARGSAIVLVSEDLDELFAQCDQIVAMYDGRLQTVHDVDGLTPEVLARDMVGEAGPGLSAAAGGDHRLSNDALRS
jgi:simple sugar transport system ATP-binding protein